MRLKAFGIFSGNTYMDKLICGLGFSFNNGSDICLSFMVALYFALEQWKLVQ